MGEADSPLQSKTVSKMKLMEKDEILKLQNELATNDNTELKEGIQKLTESGLEYLTDFCKLHKVKVKGASFFFSFFIQSQQRIIIMVSDWCITYGLTHKQTNKE